MTTTYSSSHGPIWHIGYHLWRCAGNEAWIINWLLSWTGKLDVHCQFTLGHHCRTNRTSRRWEHAGGDHFAMSSTTQPSYRLLPPTNPCALTSSQPQSGTAGRIQCTLVSHLSRHQKFLPPDLVEFNTAAHQILRKDMSKNPKKVPPPQRPKPTKCILIHGPLRNSKNCKFPRTSPLPTTIETRCCHLVSVG